MKFSINQKGRFPTPATVWGYKKESQHLLCQPDNCKPSRFKDDCYCCNNLSCKLQIQAMTSKTETCWHVIWCLYPWLCHYCITMFCNSLINCNSLVCICIVLYFPFPVLWLWMSLCICVCLATKITMATISCLGCELICFRMIQWVDNSPSF